DKSFVAHFTKPDTRPTVMIPQKPVLKKAPTVDRDGVPQWAKEAFGKESRTIEIMASMDSNGKIGSVYFEGEGRIRTTHISGPTESTHIDRTTVRFNISQSEARDAYWKIFEKDNHDEIEEAEANDDDDAREDLLEQFESEYREWLK